MTLAGVTSNDRTVARRPAGLRRRPRPIRVECRTREIPCDQSISLLRDASVLAFAPIDDLTEAVAQLHAAGCAIPKALLEMVSTFDEQCLWPAGFATATRAAGFPDASGPGGCTCTIWSTGPRAGRRVSTTW